MSWLSDFLGFNNGKIRQAIQDGGVIIDLRTAYEFDQGHIPLALNIPVDRIKVNIRRIRDLGRPVILCGSNSAQCMEAAAILRHAGIDRVYDGGNWQSLWKVKQS